jgi:XTP/dITP diphosphohydrolase
VIHIDSYQNAITNISQELFKRVGNGNAFEIYVQSKYNMINRINKQYNETDPGDLLAIFNSSGLMEIAIRNGNAAGLLNLDTNSTIRVEFKESTEEKLKAFERLLVVMDELREKCPWDREQTLESLRNLTIEETYELADAIIDQDLVEIRKELGDLMLHIVFYSKIGSEKGAFDVADVLNGICDKLVFRHPHVFGDRKVKDAVEVLENWEELKMKEGNRSVLSGVPVSLPAMIKAHRIQDKVRAVGFDWDEREQVWDKVTEEIQEVKHELTNGQEHEKMEEEIGDLLFSVINAARLYNVEPETALERTNRKFMHRFKYLESKAQEMNRSLKEMSLEEMEAIWQEAKSI